MCSRTRENNKNKVGPVIWDTLYLFVSDEPDTSRTKSEITSEISATNGGRNVDEAANDE